MARKRKSASVKKDPAVSEENRRSKKRISSAATKSVEDFVGNEEAEVVFEGATGESVEDFAGNEEEEEEVVFEGATGVADGSGEKLKRPFRVHNPKAEEDDDEGEARFLGEPVPDEEARKRWPHRYKEKLEARCHFLQAEVDGNIFSLEDYAYVKSDPEKPDYICKIIELFQAVDGSQHFTAQWFYRANDTDIGICGNLIDNKLIFLSEVKDDNPLGCLVKKIKIEFLPLKAEIGMKEKLRSTCDYYCDRIYVPSYTSFLNLPLDSSTNSSESGSTISSDTDAVAAELSCLEQNNESTLLDLYSGCGAMSTGLCLGANSCGVKLITKWAVDINQYACESLKLNHPETEVRNESAEDFLQLLKEWEKLYVSLLSSETNGEVDDEGGDDGQEDEADEDDSEVFEVDEILSICYGDPNKNGNPKLHFKIRWKGYGPEEDTWEPLEGLSGCKEKLKEYVSKGYKSKMLPLPGTVDVICGGPPCQGISGFNRFRNKEAPLDDPKNKQLIVFMDIVAYLRPKFVLMENVVDIVKFAGGFLGRYALARLVAMDYQARMGMMAAGAYGLPQFRMRMFMWGALRTESLPQYPLPTHNVVARGVTPLEFESNVVAYEDTRDIKLKAELFLGDAISDLPAVENNEKRDEMPYGAQPNTEFQRFIRLRKDEMPGFLMSELDVLEHSLYDHRPLCLNKDDYERACAIPKKKGANFRDLPGVRVRADNKVEWDPNVERKLVSSGKPLVPDYAMTFVNGTSSKPFARLWWDETVPTVVTRAEPHNQKILHPAQDRVLTIRENARLQGFPDYYKLLGPIKERYTQVGNAVAVPVARALGYSLALALRGLSANEPVFRLPEDYPLIRDVPSPSPTVET